MLIKLGALRPAFMPGSGIIKVANASPMSDGDAAVMLVLEARLTKLKATLIVKILGWGEAILKPSKFITVPPKLCLGQSNT